MTQEHYNVKFFQSEAAVVNHSPIVARYYDTHKEAAKQKVRDGVSRLLYYAGGVYTTSGEMVYFETKAGHIGECRNDCEAK